MQHSITSYLQHHPTHGTPINIPGHLPAMFPQALYGTYVAHQAGAPEIYPLSS